ncbi:MAG: hypothetical protein WCO06_07630, partial [Candidatus Roizmanbacteria bacterium]
RGVKFSLSGGTVARVHIHVRNDNEIYNISSTLLNNTSPIATPSATINFMNIIKNHLGNGVSNLKTIEQEPMILNKELLGLEQDETNYYVMRIHIKASREQLFIDRNYFISATNGEILNMIDYAFNENSQ